MSIPKDNETKFKDLLGVAQHHRERAEWELAENALHDAENLCKEKGFPNAATNQLTVLFQLAEVARRHGKYDVAIRAHRQALESTSLDTFERLRVLGELGVNLRHQNKIQDARKVLEEQYSRSEALLLEIESQKCRAAGNRGMVLLQAFNALPDQSDHALLNRAIADLEERVRSAAYLARRLDQIPQLSDREGRRKRLEMWETIGHSRLALAYIAQGDKTRAIEHGRLAVETSKGSDDPTVRAISRFFYGNALLHNGQSREAMPFFTEGRCTPAIALCKESSREHRTYLETLAREGVDMSGYDEQGYSALDYAVYSEDQESVRIILDALVMQRKIGITGVESHANLARLRKHFREIFHERFRPILNLGRADCIQNLREKYAESLSQEEEKRNRFDVLRLVRYIDFVEHNRMPRFDPGSTITKSFGEVKASGRRSPFIVFFSYRWIGRETDPTNKGQDDLNHTQYQRMIQALDELLEDKHEDIDRSDVYIWLDCACIDQENVEAGRRERGINSLPMFVAQCDVMISLVDAQYFTRAWCAVEVLIMQALRQSYSKHLWYVHNLHSAGKDRISGSLDRGVDREELKPSELKVSNESDRRYIQFLERQSLLLGKTRGL